MGEGRLDAETSVGSCRVASVKADVSVTSSVEYEYAMVSAADGAQEGNTKVIIKPTTSNYPVLTELH